MYSIKTVCLFIFVLLLVFIVITGILVGGGGGLSSHVACTGVCGIWLRINYST